MLLLHILCPRRWVMHRPGLSSSRHHLRCLEWEKGRVLDSALQLLAWPRPTRSLVLAELDGPNLIPLPFHRWGNKSLQKRDESE